LILRAADDSGYFSKLNADAELKMICSPFLVFLGMCCSRKYPYFPHKRDWNFLGVVGVCKIKN